jgi:glycosyltransferase involved in cell wall biosynthesis
MELLKEANFSILATLSDTFGFSAIESLSVGTPVIATSQGALPEFIADGINGLLIPLATDPFGEWIHVGRSDKESRRFAYIYREEIERLAAAVLEAVTPYCHARSKISAMRRSARQTAELHFDTDILSPQIDQIYDISVTGDV